MKTKHYVCAELEIIRVNGDLLTGSIEVKEHDDEEGFGPLHPLKPN